MRFVFGNVDAHFFQLGHPGGPADPIFVVAQVHQGGQSGLQRQQFGYALGVEQAEVHGDVGAEAMTHQDGALDAHLVQETAQIFGHIGGRIAGGRDIAVAMAAEIVGGNAVLAAQDGGHVEMPDRQIAKKAVQHHDVGAHADRDVMQVNPVRFYLWHRSIDSPYSM